MVSNFSPPEATASFSTSQFKPEERSPVHLAVVIHGLWGSDIHTSYLAKSLAKRWSGKMSPISAIDRIDQEKDKKKKGKEKKKAAEDDKEEELLDAQAVDLGLGGETEGKARLVVLNTSSNSNVNTLDGIDWCGERVVAEIKTEIKRLAEEENSYVSRFSIVGYSLGGLVARYAIGLLEVQGYFDKPALCPTSMSSSPFEPPIPVQFTTFATPHIGIPPSPSTFGRLVNWIGGRVLSRSGEQLYLRDSGWEEPGSSTPRSLLSAMAHPHSSFYKALERFTRVDIYVNGLRDVTVPYRTGGIDPIDTFDESRLERGEIQVQVDPDYPVMISSFKHLPPSPPPKLWERVKSKFNSDKLPWFLSPSRLPLRFPLNYLTILFLPILFPTFLVLVLWRFRGDGRNSRRRILMLDEGWKLEDGETQEDEVPQAKSKRDNSKEKQRIERMLKRMQKVAEVAGEDNVKSEYPAPAPTAITPTSSSHSKSNGTLNHLKSNGNGDGSAPSSAKFDEEQELLRSQIQTKPPLMDSQLEMCENLNRIKTMRKHRTWFEGVLNSHAIIIVRTPSMEMHKKGLPVIQHFVDKFEI